MPLEELKSFLVGSDGAFELASLADKSIPGSDELIGPISQFWEQEKYLTTRTGIRRRLARINTAHCSLRDVFDDEKYRYRFDFFDIFGNRAVGDLVLGGATEHKSQ